MTKYTVLAATAAIAVAFNSLLAHASCFEPRKGKVIPYPALPKLEITTVAPFGNPSIVGLWHIVHNVNGQPFNEAFEQWHSDGTEFEFADFAPATGDICLGEWTKIGPSTVKLFHTGWTFDAGGNPTGTMVLTEKNTVSPNGRAFNGTFDIQFFDSNGKLKTEMQGDTMAQRLPAQPRPIPPNR